MASSDGQAILQDAKTPITPTKTPSSDPLRFHSGVIMKGKIIGLEDVKEESGDKICNEAMIKLKALVTAKKEHKQQVFLKISLEGVHVIDARTNEVIHKHPVKSISYIARDPLDARAFGYIFTLDRKNFQYLAIKTEKNAIETILQLRDLFEVVYDMEKLKESSKPEASNKQVEQSTASVTVSNGTESVKQTEAATNNQVPVQQAPQSGNIFDLDDSVQKVTSSAAPEVARQPSIFDVPVSSPSSQASPPISNSLDFFEATKPAETKTEANRDLFSLSVSPELFSPPDKFSELKKTLNNLSSPQQSVQATAFPQFPNQPQQQPVFNPTMQTRQPPMLPQQTAYGTPNPFSPMFAAPQVRQPFMPQQQQPQVQFGMQPNLFPQMMPAQPQQFQQQPIQQQPQQQQQQATNSFPW